MVYGGDLELPHPEGPLVIDTSVIHPSVVWHQQNLKPTAATGVREKMKVNKYEKICTLAEKSFLPFVFQAFGGIGSYALDFLGSLKTRPACLHVYEPTKFVDSVRIGLVCKFMRINSKLILKWLHLILPTDSGGVVTNNPRM